MIAADQPACFPAQLLAMVSSRQDGSVLDRQKDTHDTTVVRAREQFCEAQGISYEQCVYQQILYGDDQPYDTCIEVTDAETVRWQPGVHADALMTLRPGVGLFLPVADCVATVVYDPVKRRLAVLHLGRHSSLTDIVSKVVSWFKKNASDPQSLIVWMSPSVKQSSYKLTWFTAADDPRWQPFVTVQGDAYYLDLAGYNRARFVEMGVLPQNIYVSAVDTAQDDNYFSHTRGDVSGRIAVVAMMK